MGSNEKKKALTAYVSPELKDEFDRICEVMAVNKSKFLENSIFRFVRDNRSVLEEDNEEDEESNSEQ